jgi:hypothetical protein
MTDNGRKDVERDVMDIERDLERLKPVAAPADLRRRVLDRAAEVRKSPALSPRIRILAAACSIVIVAVLGLDPLIGRHEAARMAALFDGRQTSLPFGEVPSELAEVLTGRGRDAERLARVELAAAAAARKEQARQVREAWRRLKGWLDDETSEDLI